MLTPVGFFVELDPGRAELASGSIHDALKTDPMRDASLLATYLESGIVVIDMMEATKDVVGGSNYITAGSSIKTDGTWIWRVDLAYYLRNYNLELPFEFAQQIRSRSYLVPSLTHDEIVAVAHETIFGILKMRTADPPPMRWGAEE